MIAKAQMSNKRSRTARLPLLKERYQKLILKQRQEIEKELLESFREEYEVDLDAEPEPEQAVVIEGE